MRKRKSKKVIAKFRAPRGFRFKINKHYHQGHLYNVMVELRDAKSNRKIGHINLVREGRFCETHSWLDEKHRNKGWGVLMYSRAIQWALENEFKIRSSGGSSEMAQRVWRGKTIRKSFRIRTCKSTYSYDRGNPAYDTFFAYAK